MKDTNTAIDIEDIVERALENAFSRALGQTLRTRAEELFKKALAPLARKLERMMETASTASR